MLCLCQRWFARTRGVHFTEMERRIYTASRRTTRIRDACQAVQNTELICRIICHQPRLNVSSPERMHRQLYEHAPTRPVESPNHSPYPAHSRSAQQPTRYRPIKCENGIGAQVSAGTLRTKKRSRGTCWVPRAGGVQRANLMAVGL